jgi:FkbM family methyltransferase
MDEGLRYVELSDGFGCYSPANGSGDTAELEFIHAEIFGDNCYLRNGITLPRDAVVLDVGANVGLFTLYVKARFPDARVVAFEPMPGTFRALRANLAHHGCTGVEAVEQALGAGVEADVPFAFYPGLPGNSTRYPEQKARTRQLLAELPGTDAERAHRGRLLTEYDEVRVPVARLSDTLAALGLTGAIDLLKVDVEGAEADVLGGIDDRDWARVRQVVLEVQDLAGQPAEVRTILEGRGFAVTVELAELPDDGVLGGLGSQTMFARRP